MEEAGLDVEVDSRGNVVGRLVGRSPELPEVWTGSHLDSVPAGGRFDGALGVVAGLEAVLGVGQSERTLGSWSSATRRPAATGAAGGSRTRSLPGSYVELHIEQGPRLAAADAPLGVVTRIAGMVRRQRVFEGRGRPRGHDADGLEEDALSAAAEYVLRVREVAAGIPDAVATVGELEVAPGAVNVVPSRVQLTVDARAPDQERLERLVSCSGSRRRTTRSRRSALATATLSEELEARGLRWSSCRRGPATTRESWPRRAWSPDALRALAGGRRKPLAGRALEPGGVALAVEVLTGALRRLAEA